jgi:hypothetical protein
MNPADERPTLLERLASGSVAAFGGLVLGMLLGGFLGWVLTPDGPPSSATLATRKEAGLFVAALVGGAIGLVAGPILYWLLWVRMRPSTHRKPNPPTPTETPHVPRRRW